MLVARGVRPAKLSILPNFSDAPPSPTDGGQAFRASLGIAATDRVLVSIGRLSPEKGQRYLVAAMAEIARQSRQPVRLVLVGDGPDRPALEKLAASFGLVDQVKFVGHRADIWPYHWIADVFVLPSLSEGSPLALLESMAAAKPIVATRVGGVPEAVQDGESALLVPAGEPLALAQAILAVLEDANLRDRLSQGAALAATRLAPGQYVRRLRRIYQDVLQSDR